VLASGEVAVVGEIASLNTADGEFYAGQALTTLVPRGYFSESKTGDGTVTVKVELFHPVRQHGFTNDTGGGEVLAANIGSECFIKDGDTVSMTSTNRSKAGRVAGLEGGIVWVENGPAVTGPTGAGIGGQPAAIATQTRQLDVSLNEWSLATGGPMVIFSGGSTDGATIADSEAKCLRFNNAASTTKFIAAVGLPDELDPTADVVVKALVSKSGATITDVVSLDFEAFLIGEGDLHDADADAGGTSSVLSAPSAAAKTTEVLSLTIDAADVDTTFPKVLNLSMVPTAGTFTVDDVLIHRVWLEYTPREIV